MPWLAKEPKRTSIRSEAQHIHELLTGNEIDAYETLRMPIDVFHDLCVWLRSSELLFDTEGVAVCIQIVSLIRCQVEEAVAIFVYIVGQGASSRNTQHEFQHSGETITRFVSNFLAN